MSLALLALSALLPLVLARPQLRGSSCGYESCPSPKDGFINIHLVPHTHDDVGWLKTVDQYYYGNRMSIQDAGVQYILDSVVQELLHDPRKRFIYVETAYFWKWWQEQSDTLRHQVKKLVNRGQLEFIGGAWSMHDEATTHYQSIIDQFTWGLKRLSDTFGECGRPRVGWQIDPFGHSRESASIMAKIGFDGLFLGRIDWEDKSLRMKNKTAEMIWFTSTNDKSDSSKLFTSVMYNTYSAPRGFCFDINCHDEPIVDNKHSPEFNAKQRADEFLSIMKNYSEAYRTNNVLVTMGDDFMYMDAHMNFKNMDKLIHQINKMQKDGSKFHTFYSSPSCYLKAVHDTKTALPTKYDDFMPYSSDPMAFWTGYFTSRPTVKYFERKGNNYLQVCKQLYALSNLGPEDRGDLIAMREAMGIMQHHDAVTGTEKQHVADDYSRILTEGFKECDVISEAAFNKLMPKAKSSKTMKIENCMLLNISSCPLTEKENTFVVTIYNPLSRNVDYPVRLPVISETSSYTVLCPQGKKIPNQVIKIPEAIQKLPGRTSSAKAEVVFIAKNLPPVGFRSYYIVKGSGKSERTKERLIGNGKMNVGYSEGSSVTLDSKGNLKEAMIAKKSLPITQSFYYYNSAVGNNEIFANRSSGAYIFRPNGSAILIQDAPKTKTYEGPIVSEVHQTFTDWVSQVIRVYSNIKHIEYQWMIGPIPISEHGKEIISRFSTPLIKNNGEFLTDSNGREFLIRKLNYRPSWPVNLAEKVPGNYYPLTTTISITDHETKLAVVTDRAQGGSSLNDGEIEIMVHRRLTHDDAFGVGEALNETAFGEGLVARGSHFATFGTQADVRKLMQEKIMAPWVFVSPTNGLPYDDWKNSFTMEFSGLNANLPDNVQILTLEPWSGTSLLLRLEHIMESNEDPNLSKPATVKLMDIFSGWKITSIEETMLGANQKVKDSKRLVWTTEENDHPTSTYFQNKYAKDTPDIVLNPMQIRTFVIQVRRSQL